MADTSDEWKITKHKGIFYVTGKKVEKFARRTDFDNDQGVQRLRDILRREGVMHQLVREGVEAGQTIQVGQSADYRFEY